MFDRFSKPAQTVLELAQTEVHKLGHAKVEPAHLLLGILSQRDSFGAQALRRCGITLDDAREAVLAAMGRGVHAPDGITPFSPRSREILEAAAREALACSSNVQPHQVLLALLEEAKITELLAGMGVKPGYIRLQLEEILSGSGLILIAVEVPSLQALVRFASGAGPHATPPVVWELIEKLGRSTGL